MKQLQRRRVLRLATFKNGISQRSTLSQKTMPLKRSLITRLDAETGGDDAVGQQLHPASASMRFGRARRVRCF